MLITLSLIIGLYGVVIGSALNAFVWRLHEQKSWVKGKSICEECRHELAGKDLVPVLSWLVLRGRCRYCRKPIGFQHVAVELSTSALFVLSALELNPMGPISWIKFIIWLWLLIQLIILFIYDLRWMILPDRVTYPAIGITAVTVAIVAATGSSTQVWLGPLEAAAIAGGFFFFLAAIAGGRLMGGGDVKLVFLMGLMLGIQKTALALFLGFNAAALTSVVLILLKIRKRSDYVPFGPFLIVGTIIAYLYGHIIITGYLRFNGL
jgi:prepilin signal peptidase PulO-like enzyme (type II secretory pathway)